MLNRLFALVILVLLSPSVSFGADRYVCIYPSGYDYGAAGYTYAAGYTSMNAAEATEVAIDGSGSGAGTWDGDTLYFDILHGSGANTWDAAPDTAAVEFDGWDCQNGGKLVVRTMTAAMDQLNIESRPDFSSGDYDTTEHILKVAGRALELDNDHDNTEVLTIDFIGIQIETSAAGECVEVHSPSYYGTINFTGCWFEQTEAEEGIDMNADTTCDLEIINCVFIGNSTGTVGIRSVSINATTYAYHCNVFGQTLDGIKRFDGTLNVINCNVGDCNDDIDRASATNYNCSDDGDGTNPILPSGGSWANEITTAYTNQNALNTGNIYLGSPLTQTDDARVPATDIAGNPRETDAGQSVTVGAYEYVVVGGGISIPVVWHHLRRHF